MKTIVAVAKNWAIGANNDLLFHLPLDMKHFREITLNKTVVMGANTLKSFRGGRPLKNRTNIVLCPEYDILTEGIIQAKSMEELFEILLDYNSDDVYIIGGGMMYRTMLPYCDEAIITKVDCIRDDATVFFPNLDELQGWQLVEQTTPIEDNGNLTTYNIYRNSSPKK